MVVIPTSQRVHETHSGMNYVTSSMYMHTVNTTLGFDTSDSFWCWIFNVMNNYLPKWR